MWEVSQDFLESIPVSGDIETVVTVEVPGQTIVLDIVSGAVSGQSGSNVRRQANLIVSGGDDKDLYEAVSQEGTEIAIKHGPSWGTQKEIIPVLTGFLSVNNLQRGDGSFPLTAADYGANLNDQALKPSVTQSGSMTRSQAIFELVAGSFPDMIFHDDGSDTGTLSTDQTWTGKRWEAVNTLATDGMTDVFFLPDGSLQRRAYPVAADPVWSVRAGGTSPVILTEKRARQLDSLFNAVQVLPGSANGTQDWSSVLVQITNPSSPRYPGRKGIGLRVKDIQAPTAMTVEEAMALGAAKLDQLQGASQTINLGILANVALEIGDAVEVYTSAWEGTPAESLIAIVDAFNIDLMDGSMTVDLRSGSSGI